MDTNETSIGWITLKAGMKIQGKVLDLVMTVDLTMASTATYPYSAPKTTHCQIQKTVLALDCDPALNKVEILLNSAC